MAHTHCMLDKQGYMHARACIHPRARAHARRRNRARTRTHTQICNIAFPRQQLFANAPHCYVIRTLSVLLLIVFCNSNIILVKAKHCCFSGILAFYHSLLTSCIITLYMSLSTYTLLMAADSGRNM